MVLLCAATVGVAQESSATATTETLFREIPSSSELKEGDTADDEKTSHAVEEILRRCANAYHTVTHLHAVGRYVQAYKSKRLGENLNDATIELLYRRPDRMKIVFAGKGMEVQFVADGTTVTQLNGEKKEYIRFAQPDSLEAFADEERAGEISDDETNSIPNSISTPLLISADPFAWLHSNVLQYIYNGVEDVKLHDPGTSETRRVSCWRIKFVQSNPKLVVENWVDRESYFLRKVAIIQSVDEQGDFVESYASASRGRMRIAIYDKISTSPDDVPISRIRAEIPKNYKFRKYEPEAKTDGSTQETVWSRLVRAAAIEKGERTSVSLLSLSGDDLLTLTKVREFESRIISLQSGGSAWNNKPSLLVGRANKALSIIPGDTSAVRELVLPRAMDQCVFLKQEAALPLLIGAEASGDTVYAFDLDMHEKWRYQKDASIESVATCASDSNSFVYVGYSDGRGVRALDASGKVRFASRRVSMVGGLTVARESSASVPLVVRSSSDIACMRKDLKIHSRFESDTLAGPCEVDTNNPDYPLVAIGFTSADDVLLQRVSPEGYTSWTMNLAPEATDIKGAAVDFAKLNLPVRSAVTLGPDATTSSPVNRTLQTCIVALLSDGRMSIVSAEGDLVWRGRVTGIETVGVHKDAWNVFGLAIGDLDEDGEDEIYTGSDTQLLRITTVSKP